MISQIVLLFPGQGSQTPGMGGDLNDVFPAARAVFAAAEETIGDGFIARCFHGPAEELTKTHNAQPALLAHGAALWAVLRDDMAGRVVAAAGHSLGEFTAYHAADAIALPAALKLVRRRGELMYDAGVRRPGAMAAILGELDHPIEDICVGAASDGVVVPANFNCPGQIVISGEPAGVDRAMELAKAAGARRAIKLNVSGAFHSPLMADAVAGLQEALDLALWAEPHFPVYANVNAQPVTSSVVARRVLADQLTSPVQWTREVEGLASRYPGALYVEMGPGNVLKGLVKKIAPSLNVVTCGTAAEVDALLAQLAA